MDMNIDISQEAALLLARLYRMYLERREDGLSKNYAQHFSNPQALFEHTGLEGGERLCAELAERGLLRVLYDESGRPNHLVLNKASLTYMEKHAGVTISDTIRFMLTLVCGVAPRL